MRIFGKAFTKLEALLIVGALILSSTVAVFGGVQSNVFALVLGLVMITIMINFAFR